jgi:hypothetical protein
MDFDDDHSDVSLEGDDDLSPPEEELEHHQFLEDDSPDAERGHEDEVNGIPTQSAAPENAVTAEPIADEQPATHSAHNVDSDEYPDTE